MMGRRLAMLVLGVGSLAMGPLGCRGEGGPTGTPGEERIGPVDLTQAPATLAMTCNAGASPTLVMPCLIGLDLAGPDPNAVGLHATECRLAQDGGPLAWTFLLPLADVRADPATSLNAPAGLPTVTGSQQAIVLQGEPATMSSVTGDLTFARVDPTVRAFAGAFKGTVIWTGASGAQTPCRIDGAFWGAPGDFL